MDQKKNRLYSSLAFIPEVTIRNPYKYLRATAQPPTVKYYFNLNQTPANPGYKLYKCHPYGCQPHGCPSPWSNE